MNAGLLAEFADAGTLQRAADRLRAARLGAVETHTPLPSDDDEASILPLLILFAGVIGAAGIFAMQWYATARGYPVNSGGRPAFSWPAFVPMAFEFGVLIAVATGFAGFMIACRLPALYDPIDEVDGFRRASRDGFFLAFRSADATALGSAYALLRELGPVLLAELPR